MRRVGTRKGFQPTSKNLWEGACAGAFWDMYDWPDDDFNGDGYGDVLSLTPEFILGFVVDSLPTQYGGRVDSLYGLWYNWMRTNIDDQPQLDSVYREHGMSCCVGMTGNVNGDFDDAVDVSDITALINHLFITFEPLLCPAEANTNGDPGGAVDISDLTVMVNYLMAKSRSLPMCQ